MLPLQPLMAPALKARLEAEACKGAGESSYLFIDACI